MPKRVFRFTLYVKDTDKIFGEGMGPGEFVIEEYTYKLTKYDCAARLTSAIAQDRRKMIERYIGVRIDELHED